MHTARLELESKLQEDTKSLKPPKVHPAGKRISDLPRKYAGCYSYGNIRAICCAKPDD